MSIVALVAMKASKNYKRKKNRPAWLGFTLGLIVLLIYAGMRASVYAAFPLDEYLWFVRDTIMNIPRIISFALALVVGLLFWGRRELGFHVDKPISGFLLGTVIVILGSLGHIFRSSEYGYGEKILLVLTVSSFIVALFEETLFRGVIYQGMQGLWSARVAIWGSSIIFAIFHVQAQPVSSWPSIFLFGVMSATMRAAGIGLWWNILSHGLLDSMVFLGSYGEPVYPWLSVLVFALNTAFALVLFWKTSAVINPRQSH